MEPLTEKNFISTKEAAEVTGYNSDYLARLCREGKILSTQIGRTWIVDQNSLEAFVKSQDARKRELAQELSKSREQEYRTAQTLPKPRAASEVTAAKKIVSPYVDTIGKLPRTAEALKKAVRSPRMRALSDQVVAVTVALVVTLGSVGIAQAGYIARAAQNVVAFTNATHNSLLTFVAAADIASTGARAYEAGAVARTMQSAQAHMLASDLHIANATVLVHVRTNGVYAAATATSTPTSLLVAYQTPDPGHSFIDTNTASALTAASFESGTRALMMHPVDTLEGVYVGTGIVAVTTIQNFLSSYTDALTSAGNASYAVSNQMHDTLASVAPVSVTLSHGALALYAQSVDAWVTSSPSVARTLTQSALALGTVIGGTTNVVPSTVGSSYDASVLAAVNATPIVAEAVLHSQIAVGTGVQSISDSAFHQTAQVGAYAGDTVRTSGANVEDTALGLLGNGALALDTNLSATRIGSHLEGVGIGAVSSASQTAAVVYAGLMPQLFALLPHPVAFAGAQFALTTYQFITHTITGVQAELALLTRPFGRTLAFLPIGSGTGALHAIPFGAVTLPSSGGTIVDTTHGAPLPTGAVTVVNNYYTTGTDTNGAGTTGTATDPNSIDGKLATLRDSLLTQIDVALESVNHSSGGGGNTTIVQQTTGGTTFDQSNVAITGGSVNGLSSLGVNGPTTLASTTISNAHVTGDVVIDGNLTVLGSTTLSISSSNATFGDSTTTNATTTNFFASSAHLTLASIDTLNSTLAFISTLNTTLANIQTLNATNTNAVNATSTNLYAANGVIDNLISTAAHLVTASIDNLFATNATFTNSTTTNATSTNLYATNANIDILTGVSSLFQNATSTNLAATNFTLGNATFSSLLGNGLVNQGGLLSVSTTSLASGFFLNGGNTFNVGAILGTLNSQALSFITNGLTRLTIDAIGNALFSGDVTAANLNATGTLTADIVSSHSLTTTGAANIGTLSAGSTTLASLTIGNLNGILRATNGVVSTGLVDLASEVSNILPVANGGTGVASFGGTNTLLFTTAANTLASIPAVASSVLITDLSGAPTESQTLPTAVQNNISATNIANFGAPFYNFFHATTTDALAEGSTSLYYTDARARNALSVTTPLTYSSTTGTFGLGTVGVANGGTGSTTLTGILIGAGTSPLDTLVVGNGLALSGTMLSISTTSLASGFFQQGGNSFGTTAALGTNDTNALAFKTNGLEVGRFDAAGNFGIGTTTPSANLAVQGDTYISGTANVGGLTIQAAAAGIVQCLHVNGDGQVFGTGSDCGSASGSAGGTVTSVNASGGSTGLTFSGGPITTFGSLTLGGTLTVANGGTGSTTLTGLVKGNGTGGVRTAVAGTDYQAPLTFGNLTVGTGLNVAGGTGAVIGSGASITLATSSFSGSGSNFNADFLDGLDSPYFLANSFATTSAAYWLTTKSTSDLIEGSNLYYTPARVAGVIAGTTTDALAEGTINKYFTDARADARINATSTIGTLTSAPSLSTLSIALSGILHASSGVLSTGAINLASADVTGALTVANGGTGSTTLTGLVKGNGTGAIQTAVAGTDYQAPLAFTYPLVNTANTVSLAFGTTTVNSWSAPQTFNGGMTIGSLAGVLYGNSGSVTSVATSTPTPGLGLGYSGTLGSFVGGTSGSFTIATSSLYTGTTGQFPYFSGTNTITATSSLFLAASGNVGVGSTSPYRALSVAGSAVFTGGDVLASTFTATGTATVGNLVDSGIAANSLTYVNGSQQLSAVTIGSGLTFTSGTLNSTVSTSSLALDTQYFKQGGNAYGALATLGTTDSNALRFIINGTERARLDTSGNFGVGTTSPYATASIFDTPANVNVTAFAIGSSTSAFATTTLFSVSNTGAVTAFGTIAGTAIIASGNIQTTGSFFFGGGGKSRINGSVTDGNITLSNAAATSFGLLQFGGTTSAFPALAVSGANLIVEDASGGLASNLGVGTTSPTQRLSVQGNGLFSGNVTAANITATGTASVATLNVSGNSQLSGGLGVGVSNTNTGTIQSSGTILAGTQYIGTGSANAPLYSFTTDTQTGVFRPGSNQIGFSTGGVQRAQFDGNGFFGIGTTTASAMLSVGGNALINGAVTGDGFIDTTETANSLTYANSSRQLASATLPSYITLTAGTLAISQLPIAQGGTNATSFTSGLPVYYNGTALVSSSTLAVNVGGTGSTTLTGLLKGNGTGAIQTAVAGVDYAAAGNYITALTGDVTASGPGSAATTLATVNTNTGSFGSSTAIPTFTVNGKGLITAAGTVAVIAPAGTLTGTTLASNVVSSSLTSVGTLTSLTVSGTSALASLTATNATTTNLFANTLTGTTLTIGSSASTSISSAGIITTPGVTNTGNEQITGGLGIGISNTNVGTILTTGNITSGGQFIGKASDSFSAPSFTWGADLSTGIYHTSSNQIGFSTGGVARGAFDANGYFIANSNIGIGTTSPYRALSVSGSAVFSGGDVLASTLTATSTITGDHFVATSNTTMNTFPAGIIVGTSSPQWTLSSRGILNFSVPTFRPTTLNSPIALDLMPNGTVSSGDAAWNDICDADLLNNNNASNCLHLAAGQTSMHIDSVAYSGATPKPLVLQVGSGTLTLTTDSHEVEALSGSSGSYKSISVGRTTEEVYLAVAAGAGQWAAGTVAGDSALTTNGAGKLFLMARDNSNAPNIVLSGANTGVGTTSPYALLSIGGNVVVGAATTGGTPGDLFLPKLGAAAGAFLAVDASGKVISTTTPISGVSSVSNSDGTLTISPTTGAVVASLALGHTNTWTGLQQFNANASTTQLTVTGNTYLATTGGSVGVGTTTPATTFSVQGAGLFSGNLTVAGFTATGTESILGNSQITGGLGVGISNTTSGTILTSGNITSGGQFIGKASDSFSAPSFTWGADLSTGIYHSSSNNIGFSTGGVARGAFDANGNFTTTGSIGVGSTTPGSTLSVNGNAQITSTLTVGNLINTGLTANTLLYANGSKQESSVTLGLGLGLTSGTLSIATSSLYTGTTGQFPYFSGTNTITATSSLFLATSGNIGIGTTTPFGKLAVSLNSTDAAYPGNNAFIIASSTAAFATTTLFSISNTGVVTAANNVLATSGSFTSSGVTGAGFFFNGKGAVTTSGTDGVFNFVNNAGNNFTRVNFGGTSASFPALGANTATQSLYVGLADGTAGGSFGVGTSTPSQRLSVQGNALFSGDLTLANLTATGTATVGNLINNGVTANTLLYANGSKQESSVTLGTGLTLTTGTLTIATSSLYTGTTGQFPYFSGTNTITATSSIFLATSGNVGIGTTSPISQLSNTSVNTLDTAGTGSNLTNGLTWAANGAGYALSGVNTSAASNANGLFLKTTGTASTNRILTLNANGTDTFVALGNGNVGIGTTSPLSMLAIGGNSSIGADYNVAAPTNGLLVEGNVGIGTTSPSSTLTVGGDITASGNLSAQSAFLTYANTSSSATSLTQGVVTNESWVGSVDNTVASLGGGVRNLFSVFNISGHDVRRMSAVVGRVVMGSTGSPASTGTDGINFYAFPISLHTGDVLTNHYGLFVDGGTTPGATLTNNYGVYVADLQNGTNHYAFYQAGATDQNYFAGTVGIGTSSPSYKLDIAGGFVNVDQYSGYKQAGNTILYASTTNSSLAIGASTAAAWMAATSTITDNVAIGVGALAATPVNILSGHLFPAIRNIAIGSNTLSANVSGDSNTAIGYAALLSNISGMDNTAIGPGALTFNTTGYYNTALGLASLNNLTTGFHNVAIGMGAGRYLANGSSLNQTSSDSTYLGYSTFPLADGDNNETVIGYLATGNGSNSVTIGNTSVTKTILNGNVGVGTTTPYGALSLGGGNLVIGAATAGGTPGDLFLPKLGTGAGSFLAVDATGKVIATTTPSGSSPVGTTGQFQYFSATNTLSATSTLFLAANGNVGVGTTSPYANLSVSSFGVQASTTPLFTVASTTGATLLTVLGSGNVGIGGVTNPLAALHIVGADSTVAGGYLTNAGTAANFVTRSEITSNTVTTIAPVATGVTVGAFDYNYLNLAATSTVAYTGRDIRLYASASSNADQGATTGLSVTNAITSNQGPWGAIRAINFVASLAGTASTTGGVTGVAGSASLTSVATSTGAITGGSFSAAITGVGATTTNAIQGLSITAQQTQGSSGSIAGLNLTATGGASATYGGLTGASLSVTGSGNNAAAALSGLATSVNVGTNSTVGNAIGISAIVTSNSSTATTTNVYGGSFTATNNGPTGGVIGLAMNATNNYTGPGVSYVYGINYTAQNLGTSPVLYGENSFVYNGGTLNNSIKGAFYNAQNAGTVNGVGTGIDATFANSSGGTASGAVGGTFLATNAGTINGGNSIYGISGSATNSGTINSGGNIIGVYSSVSNSGTLSGGGNLYDFYGSDSNALNYFAGDTLIGGSLSGNTLQAQLRVGTSTANYTGQTLLSVENSSASSLFTVLGNGNVGIGTTTPASKLTVNGAACFTQGAGTATIACGTTAGNIYYKTANTGNYDVAENYQTNDPSVVPGMIVAVDPNNPKGVTTAAAGSTILGVVSTDPGLTLGGADGSAKVGFTKPVALSGRIPVKVSLDGGAIKIGDRIALSSTPGVGQKSTQSGQTVGIALENASAPGTIEVFVQPEYTFNPGQLSLDAATGNVAIGGTGTASNLAVSGDVTGRNVTGSGSASFGGSVTAGSVIANGALTASSTSVTGTGVFGGALSAASVNTTGTVAGTKFIAPAVASDFQIGSSTVSITAGDFPSTALTTTASGTPMVDLYQIATFALAQNKALALRTDLLNSKLDAIDVRVSALEALGATFNAFMGSSSASSTVAAAGSAASFSTTTLMHALNGFGLLLENGIAQIQTMVVHNLVFSKDSNGDSAAGSGTIIAGNLTAEIQNPNMKATSKISITMTSNVQGTWFLSQKQDGSFRITLSQTQGSDTTFDYFIVQTEGQLATSTDQGAGSSFDNEPGRIVLPDGSGTSDSGGGSTSTGTGTGSDATTTPDGSPDTHGPVVTLRGSAAVQLAQGAAFTDPGASATDEVDGDVSSSIVVAGTVDTNTPGIYTITYTAHDAAGNHTGVSRTVTILAPETGGSTGGEVGDAGTTTP